MKNGNKQPFSSDIPYAFGLSNLGCMDVFGLLKVEKQSTALHGLALTHEGFQTGRIMLFIGEFVRSL